MNIIMQTRLYKIILNKEKTFTCILEISKYKYFCTISKSFPGNIDYIKEVNQEDCSNSIKFVLDTFMDYLNKDYISIEIKSIELYQSIIAV